MSEIRRDSHKSNRLSGGESVATSTDFVTVISTRPNYNRTIYDNSCDHITCINLPPTKHAVALFTANKFGEWIDAAQTLQIVEMLEENVQKRIQLGINIWNEGTYIIAQIVQ